MTINYVNMPVLKARRRVYRYVLPKGYGFSAVLVINRMSILTILVLNRVRVLYSSLTLRMLYRTLFFVVIVDKTIINFLRGHN